MANLSAFGGAQPITPGGMVELGYAEKTSHSTITSTSAASPTATGISVTVVSDGSPLDVEFYCGEATPPNTNNGVLLAALWVDGAEYDRTMGVAYNYSDGVNSGRTLYAKKRITLSAGSHTIDIRGWLANNAGLSGYFFAGTSLSGFSPAFLRVSKIVQQNDGLKPFWTPPLVTQLPGSATLGDQVLWQASPTVSTASGTVSSVSRPQLFQYDGTDWQAASGLVHLVTATMTGAGSTRVDNVFSSRFDQYRVEVNVTTAATTAWTLGGRFCAGGTPNNSASYDYVRDYMSASGANGVLGVQADTWFVTATTGAVANTVSPFFMELTLVNPYKASKTGWVSQWLSGETNNPYAGQWSGAHRSATSFDGFQVIPSSSNVSGTLTIYGITK